MAARHPPWESLDRKITTILIQNRLILRELENIMATQEELAADLAAVTEQVSKIGTETSLLLVKVNELEDALAAAGGTTPEVDAAMAALKAQVNVVDEMVPDTPA